MPISDVWFWLLKDKLDSVLQVIKHLKVKWSHNPPAARRSL
jgi:hypothetical protein